MLLPARRMQQQPVLLKIYDFNPADQSMEPVLVIRDTGCPADVRIQQLPSRARPKQQLLLMESEMTMIVTPEMCRNKWRG